MISGKRVLLGWAGVLMASAGSIPTGGQAQHLPTCAALAAPLLTAEDISAATSVLVPAIAPHKTYCKVNITVSALSGEKDGYLPGQSQQVKVGIGLPLSSTDGGSGGTQGSWNRRIEDLGRGGVAGESGCGTGAPPARCPGSSSGTRGPSPA